MLFNFVIIFIFGDSVNRLVMQIQIVSYLAMIKPNQFFANYLFDLIYVERSSSSHFLSRFYSELQLLIKHVYSVPYNKKNNNVGIVKNIRKRA